MQAVCPSCPCSWVQPLGGTSGRLEDFSHPVCVRKSLSEQLPLPHDSSSPWTAPWFCPLDFSTSASSFCPSSLGWWQLPAGADLWVASLSPFCFLALPSLCTHFPALKPSVQTLTVSWLDPVRCSPSFRMISSLVT